MSDEAETKEQARARIAIEDAQLPEVCFATRPLYGQAGVLVSIEDASKRPHERVFTCRVNATQALGLAGDLLLMLEMQLIDDADVPDYARARELHMARKMLQEIAKRYKEEQA